MAGSSNDVVELAGVSKVYHLYDGPGDRLKELLLLNRRKFHRDHWAVRDLSLKIRRGETLCIIGENGSGKSTLLKLITGLLEPSEGRVEVRGRLAALLELGSGFNPEFTGRSNIFLNSAILGFSRAEVECRLDGILRFAEIGDYVDQPIKTYSSGMLVRLAFAIAVHLDPEILVVDEALAVGDIYFRQRCMRKIHELRALGVTVIYVTHAMGDVKELGDRALWLDRGRIAGLGDAKRVSSSYTAAALRKDYQNLRSRPRAKTAAADRAQHPAEIITKLPATFERTGDGRAEILGIEVRDADGREVEQMRCPGQVLVRVSGQARAEIPLPIMGILIRNRQGVDIAGVNTSREDVQLPAMRDGDVCTLEFRIDLPELAPEPFTITPAIADGTPLEFKLCDLIEDAVALRILPGEKPVYGYMHIPCTSVLVASERDAAGGT